MKAKILISLCLLLSFFYLKAEVPTNGLVLYLPLNGNANDSSSYVNNGVNYGATPIADRFGKAKKAMYFNGTSRIEVPNSAALNLTKNRSLSCWVYIPSNVTQNWYSSLIGKPEPVYSSTYLLHLDEYSAYSSQYRYKFEYLSASGSTHYQVFSKQLYTDYKDKWLHIAATYDTISGYSKIYFNGIISDSTYIGKKIANPSTSPLYIGCGEATSGTYQTFFKGYMDEVRLYNRAVTKNEVLSMYLEGTCSNSTKNDTTTYYVYSDEFKSISPRLQFIKTESLKTKIGGCDSIVNRYAKFEYSPKTCTVINSISVTDTLIIKVNIAGILPVSNSQNILKIYPNPAKDFININFGDYTKMTGYLMLIRNELGNAVYFTPIVQESATIEIKSWGGAGIYIVQLFNSQSTLVDTRKIIVK
jgi:hypothetical protein